jgi:hypothetical protein
MLSLLLVLQPGIVYAQPLGLPPAGAMVEPGTAFVPVIFKGLTVNPQDPFFFDFIVDTGNTGFKPGQDDSSIRAEADKLSRYFLASLALPGEDQWVNLSPYEKDRILTPELGKTALGRDMLAQDYILKQLSASSLSPEKDLGRAFWDRVYAQAARRFGTTDIPVDTFNKVWVTAESADVYVKDTTAFIVKSRLKVMLESDYLAEPQIASTSNHPLPTRGHDALQADSSQGIVSPSTLPTPPGLNVKATQVNHLLPTRELANQVLKAIILPAIEKEVNEGKNFAALRQMFHAMILATWYKKNLKAAVLTRAYADRRMVSGLEGGWVKGKGADAAPEAIWKKYEEAYRRGVFNFIKEEPDALTGELIPRKYFSGGMADMAMARVVGRADVLPSAMVPVGDPLSVRVAMRHDRPDAGSRPDAAMIDPWFEMKEKMLDGFGWSVRLSSKELEVQKRLLAASSGSEPALPGNLFSDKGKYDVYFRLKFPRRSLLRLNDLEYMMFVRPSGVSEPKAGKEWDYFVSSVRLSLEGGIMRSWTGPALGKARANFFPWLEAAVTRDLKLLKGGTRFVEDAPVDDREIRPVLTAVAAEQDPGGTAEDPDFEMDEVPDDDNAMAASGLLMKHSSDASQDDPVDPSLPFAWARVKSGFVHRLGWAKKMGLVERMLHPVFSAGDLKGLTDQEVDLVNQASYFNVFIQRSDDTALDSQGSGRLTYRAFMTPEIWVEGSNKFIYIGEVELVFHENQAREHLPLRIGERVQELFPWVGHFLREKLEALQGFSFARQYEHHFTGESRDDFWIWNFHPPEPTESSVEPEEMASAEKAPRSAGFPAALLADLADIREGLLDQFGWVKMLDQDEFRGQRARPVAPGAFSGQFALFNASARHLVLFSLVAQHLEDGDGALAYDVVIQPQLGGGDTENRHIVGQVIFHLSNWELARIEGPSIDRYFFETNPWLEGFLRQHLRSLEGASFHTSRASGAIQLIREENFRPFARIFAVYEADYAWQASGSAEALGWIYALPEQVVGAQAVFAGEVPGPESMQDRLRAARKYKVSLQQRAPSSFPPDGNGRVTYSLLLTPDTFSDIVVPIDAGTVTLEFSDGRLVDWEPPAFLHARFFDWLEDFTLSRLQLLLGLSFLWPRDITADAVERSGFREEWEAGRLPEIDAAQSTPASPGMPAALLADVVEIKQGLMTHFGWVKALSRSEYASQRKQPPLFDQHRQAFELLNRSRRHYIGFSLKKNELWYGTGKLTFEVSLKPQLWDASVNLYYPLALVEFNLENGRVKRIDGPAINRKYLEAHPWLEHFFKDHLSGLMGASFIIPGSRDMMLNRPLHYDPYAWRPYAAYNAVWARADSGFTDELIWIHQLMPNAVQFQKSFQGRLPVSGALERHLRNAEAYKVSLRRHAQSPLPQGGTGQVYYDISLRPAAFLDDEDDISEGTVILEFEKGRLVSWNSLQVRDVAFFNWLRGFVETRLEDLRELSFNWPADAPEAVIERPLAREVWQGLQNRDPAQSDDLKGGIDLNPSLMKMNETVDTALAGQKVSALKNFSPESLRSLRPEVLDITPIPSLSTLMNAQPAR